MERERSSGYELYVLGLHGLAVPHILGDAITTQWAPTHTQFECALVVQGIAALVSHHLLRIVHAFQAHRTGLRLGFSEPDSWAT